jgi:cytochrome P450
LVRRIVLGDAAADDAVVTDLLDQLRRDANWAWLRPRRDAVRQRFAQRLNRHLRRSEPGSLAELVGSMGTPQAQPYGQVPHWLFAFDAVAATVMRTLALLVTYPDAMDRVQAELRGADLTRPRELPYLRACVLETVRLWPTTLAILRESTTQTGWRGRVMPARTSVVIVSSYFHRDHTRLPYANDFAPRLWLDGPVDGQPAIVPFSAGPVRCAGEDLVLFTATTLLAALLQGNRLTNVGAPLPSRRLPHTLNHARLAMAFAPQDARPAGTMPPALAEEEADFADEHKSVTFAFEMAGGPEGRREEGSPHGLAGAD